MTANDLSKLSNEDLETEFNYTLDQLKRLYAQLEEKTRIRRGFPTSLLVSEFKAHKYNLNLLCAEMERRYIP